MKTYLFTFQTNRGEAGILITTSEGLEFAQTMAIEAGAWYVDDYIIVSDNKGDIITINF